MIFDKNLDVKFEHGVTLALDSGVNVLIQGNLLIEGTKHSTVTIRSAIAGKPYGCFAVVAPDRATKVDLNHVNVSGGSFGNFQGFAFTGQFAIYGANVRIRNSTFTESAGDDGLNVKYGRVELDSCKFATNMADQVDLDYCLARVSNCIFSPSTIDANGDGLDFSGSYASIYMCHFWGFVDKGLSLGERSKILIQNTNFRENYNAVAVKDQTLSMFNKNRFIDNHRDIISYIKKPFFKSPTIQVTTKPDSLRIAVVDGDLTEIQNDAFLSNLSVFNKAFTTFTPSLELEFQLRLTLLIEEK